VATLPKLYYPLLCTHTILSMLEHTVVVGAQFISQIYRHHRTRALPYTTENNSAAVAAMCFLARSSPTYFQQDHQPTNFEAYPKPRAHCYMHHAHTYFPHSTQRPSTPNTSTPPLPHTHIRRVRSQVEKDSVCLSGVV
jgi:hypothetical protein